MEAKPSLQQLKRAVSKYANSVFYKQWLLNHGAIKRLLKERHDSKLRRQSKPPTILTARDYSKTQHNTLPDKQHAQKEKVRKAAKCLRLIFLCSQDNYNMKIGIVNIIKQRIEKNERTPPQAAGY